MTDILWYLTKDGDQSCLKMYERHYSAYQYKDGRKRKLFCGPGQKIVLRTASADAMFVWRKFIDASGQTGINCAVFRNESANLASELIRQADAIAHHVWPGERHYTYVNPKHLRGGRPGYCFERAGWRRCGRTKGGLLVLELACESRAAVGLKENAMTDHTDLIKRLREEAIIKPGRSNRLDHINPDGPEAADALEAQAVQIAKLGADAAWQPIETAPKDGTEIICLLRAKVVRLCWYFARSSTTFGFLDENGNDVNPTHWMPLPPAPQEGE